MTAWTLMMVLVASVWFVVGLMRSIPNRKNAVPYSGAEPSTASAVEVGHEKAPRRGEAQRRRRLAAARKSREGDNASLLSTEVTCCGLTLVRFHDILAAANCGWVAGKFGSSNGC
jgi:hypothetical protein